MLDGGGAAAGPVGRGVRPPAEAVSLRFKRLHEIFTARITAEPIYELKTAFSHHAYLCAEHTAALRKRVGEMREPPLGLEVVPHAPRAVLRRNPLCADDRGLGRRPVRKAVPALREALEQYTRDTNPLADAPSIRLARSRCWSWPTSSNSAGKRSSRWSTIDSAMNDRAWSATARRLPRGGGRTIDGVASPKPRSRQPT